MPSSSQQQNLAVDDFLTTLLAAHSRSEQDLTEHVLAGLKERYVTKEDRDLIDQFSYGTAYQEYTQLCETQSALESTMNSLYDQSNESQEQTETAAVRNMVLLEDYAKIVGKMKALADRMQELEAEHKNIGENSGRAPS